jgi:hypothetical protein
MLSEVTRELQQLNRQAHPRLPFGALWYTKSDDAVSYAKFLQPLTVCRHSRCDQSGNVIETHEHKGDFKEWSSH